MLPNWQCLMPVRGTITCLVLVVMHVPTNVDSKSINWYCSSILCAPAISMHLQHLCCRYKPREEISRALLGQLSRQLHTLTPTQLATLLHAMAIATG
jgi:hypothetical protein